GAPADNHNGTNFTPPFPSYTSGHAGFGGALFETMKDFFGTDNIHFTIVSDEFNTITIDQNGKQRPLMPRSFDSFSQAAEENGQTWSAPAITSASTKEDFAKVHLSTSTMNKSDPIGVVQTFKGTLGIDELGGLS